MANECIPSVQGSPGKPVWLDPDSQNAKPIHRHAQVREERHPHSHHLRAAFAA
eukprot:CAMPEP_0184470224 /NCGR_PEP_ID=MMETSP0740-20130409/90934_1 /TAXON_ID=385413 /ORGANISM="Thalassiosira miniscula, Strain CCMP1093" /LENGTH=52 /DNA_ID=CAMNT_0026846341 /DNA_START=199 /DNA_END=357 /DNA_ORIENTATION=-